MRNLMRVRIHNLDTCTRVDKIMGVLSWRTEIGLLFSYSIRQKNQNSNIILHFSYMVWSESTDPYFDVIKYTLKNVKHLHMNRYVVHTCVNNAPSHYNNGLVVIIVHL